MIHAYGEEYLSHARKVMAHMLDEAVHLYGMSLEEFYALFLVSSVAGRFQRGDCAIIAGWSGAELVRMVLEETGKKTEDEGRWPRKAGMQNKEGSDGRSPEYWTGWVLAYYQWYFAMTFEQINRQVPIGNIRNMYPHYHEMDIRQFCDAMEERVAAGKNETRIKYYRQCLGISQRQLAEAADIPIRTIQQYEQRQKNINKAQAEYLLRLSRVLQCTEAELMERQNT